jgi:hypothetical protein
MKTVIFVFFLMSVLCFSQHQNPDGDKVSIHLTPFFSSQSYKSFDGFEKQEDPFFNFNLMLKVPLSARFTVSPFYQHGKSKYDVSFQADKTYSMENSYNNFGVTFSYYFR